MSETHTTMPFISAQRQPHFVTGCFEFTDDVIEYWLAVLEAPAPAPTTTTAPDVPGGGCGDADVGSAGSTAPAVPAAVVTPVSSPFFCNED